MQTSPGSILFLASYPRSGNTFVRILLSHYALGDEAPDLDQLEETLPADTSDALWRPVVPDYDSQEISAPNNWAFRRQVMDAYRERPVEAPFRGLKTHTANLRAFGAPAFDLRPEDRVLYLARHPLDVAISNADYNDQDLDAAIDLMCRPGTCVAAGSLGSVEARGSWPEHVTGWLEETACPVLTVRYEDLTVETASTMRRIIDFIGLPLDEERLTRAIERSSFARLQRQERENGFSEAPAKTRSGRFFREGRSGQWQAQMSAEQITRLADYCGPAMARLGYLDPRD